MVKNVRLHTETIKSLSLLLHQETKPTYKWTGTKETRNLLEKSPQRVCSGCALLMTRVHEVDANDATNSKEHPSIIPAMDSNTLPSLAGVG